MTENMTEPIIIVTGDITMDWNLARTRRSKSEQSFWSADDTTRAFWQRGGAALLADLVEAITSDLQKDGTAGFSIRQTAAPGRSKRVQPDDDQFNHSYAMWSPNKYKDQFAWRVEEFLGLNRAANDSIQDWQKVVDDSPDANLVILDDAD